MSFLLYLRRFFDPLQDVAMFYNSYQSAAAALEKLSGVLEEQPTVAEPADPIAAAGGARRARRSTACASATPTARCCPTSTCAIPAGQTVALVGATGAGKSTLARLLARFYDPVAGRGPAGRRRRCDRLTDDDLRRAVVMVTQESFLFSGSVADNIAFGRPRRDPGRDRGRGRARSARTSSSRRCPSGYDTDVRKRGGRLSAGQRQLVGFARAFLADPAVLILDEATSSLDVPSERLVQRALRTLLADRTALIIAHRLSTVEIADRVLVMEDGRIVEDGTPAELVGGTGRFAGLHRAWADSLVLNRTRWSTLGDVSRARELNRDMAASVSMPLGGVQVGSYDGYEQAQAAVDYLSDEKFPVENVTIIGSDLRMIEKVTGRLTQGRAIAAGAAGGAWWGLFVGLLLGIFCTNGGGLDRLGAHRPGRRPGRSVPPSAGWATPPPAAAATSPAPARSWPAATT